MSHGAFMADPHAILVTLLMVPARARSRNGAQTVSCLASRVYYGAQMKRRRVTRITCT